MSATLQEFSAINDAAAATTKKLQKQHILADYFRRIDPTDLPLAIRFAAGRAFASGDERVLGASGAIVSDVLRNLLHIDANHLHTMAVRHGEIGEALAILWPQHFSSPEPVQPLLLSDLATAFEDLAATGNVENKKSLLRALFARCALPREAAYLAKIIFSDLRTGVKEGVLQAAVAEAFGKTLPEIHRAQLLVGDLGAVAALAREDKLATARFELFHPVQFMLATPQETAADAAATMSGRTFFAEDKLDGIRAQVHKQSDRIAIYTRTMDRTDASFPDVVAALQKVPGDFLLDGEIVPYRDGIVLPFANIQKRLGRKVLSPKLLKDHPAAFIAFDLLYLDGNLLMDQPLRDRRSALARLARHKSALRVESGVIHPQGQAAPQPDDAAVARALLITEITEVQTAEEIDAAFCRARACRNEGLVLKDPDSIYSPGRRGQMWLKLKTHLPTIDCVVTAAEYGHGKRRATLSDYTFAVWDRDPSAEGATLLNVGKAYSGVTDEEIAQLTQIFHDLSRGTFGRVHLVEPKIVLEIAFDQIQKSARHASGYALRFPRIKRIRWDKSPADADRLERVAEIYASVANTAKSHEPETPAAAEPTLFDGLV